MRLQTVARLEEMEVADFEREDPVAEDRDSPLPGLTHRYPDRVLLLITRECTPPATRAAMERLVDAGIPTGNQTVLMKGINDCPVVIHKLLHELETVRCRPSYLYNCDLAEGLSHFRTPVDTGLSIMESLWGHTSGYAIPTYIVDSPQGGAARFRCCRTIACRKVRAVLCCAISKASQRSTTKARLRRKLRKDRAHAAARITQPSPTARLPKSGAEQHRPLLVSFRSKNPSRRTSMRARSLRLPHGRPDRRHELHRIDLFRARHCPCQERFVIVKEIHSESR